ncbi:ATP-binding protein [Labedaea rhizosphaerae]|uniref:Tetratricopeptide (TPR) repeat protein n=1 Tax=Labedaea rhizosphaerae TaxID=598644 RepID=A0A4R6SFK6_LABRH|nr:tetratricopeptide repeat protein [Labedaea rhizosphaerae]TDP97975.1 tetratricopeptide (TPR) repeat protein [Labedaea rhizosphaerae]
MKFNLKFCPEPSGRVGLVQGLDQHVSLLVTLRQSTGYTQEELAALAGLTARSISDIERGLVRRPRLHSLESIADALGLNDSARREFIDHYRPRTAPQWQPRATAPAQLPAVGGLFVGRQAELARLDEVLATEPGALVVIDGMGGMGKTTLAVRWAHRVAERFPDGQLYVDLHGYGLAPPVDPSQVLGLFLDALGKPADKLPARLDARVALYRGELSRKRVLVVLDNARDVAQIRPLLPAGSASMAVVTSRSQLRGLSIRDGAHRITLRGLPDEDAATVLGRFVGAQRVAADPSAVTALVHRCAGLPLALAIVGDRAAREASESLDHFVADLAADRPLDALDGDPADPYSNIRDVCAWSYDALDPATARVFRLLALHPGHDFDLASAAVLAGATPESLDLLVSVHLLAQPTPGRWEFHDLLREFAAEQASTDEERDAAVARLLEHFREHAEAAVHQRWPGLVPAPSRPVFADEEQATAWLATEHANLIASSVWAARNGHPEHAARMADVLWRHLDVGGHYHDGRLLHESAAAAATGAAKARTLRYLGTVCDRLGEHQRALRHYQESLDVAVSCADDAAERGAHNNLGIAHWRTGAYETAEHHLQRAIALARRMGDRIDEARILGNLGLVRAELGDLATAREYQEQALAAARAIGDDVVEGNALDELGGIYRQLGMHEQALHHHEQALAKYRATGNHDGERDALYNIGEVYRDLARHAEALDHHERALRMARAMGARDGEAQALNGLAETRFDMGQPDEAARLHTEAEHLAEELGAPAERARAHTGIGDALTRLGNPAAARDHWEQALRLYTELDSPRADTVRDRLRSA